MLLCWVDIYDFKFMVHLLICAALLIAPRKILALMAKLEIPELSLVFTPLILELVIAILLADVSFVSTTGKKNSSIPAVNQ